jgi:hypothetical protein
LDNEYTRDDVELTKRGVRRWADAEDDDELPAPDSIWKEFRRPEPKKTHVNTPRIEPIAREETPDPLLPPAPVKPLPPNPVKKALLPPPIPPRRVLPRGKEVLTPTVDSPYRLPSAPASLENALVEIDTFRLECERAKRLRDCLKAVGPISEEMVARLSKSSKTSAIISGLIPPPPLGPVKESVSLSLESAPASSLAVEGKRKRRRHPKPKN